MRNIVKIRDLVFDKDLFVNYLSGTVLDRLLCSYDGLPKGVNYMIIGDPGVGKTTIILDLMANIQRMQPAARMLFVSAEMNEIDLSIYSAIRNLVIWISCSWKPNSIRIRMLWKILRKLYRKDGISLPLILFMSSKAS